MVFEAARTLILALPQLNIHLCVSLYSLYSLKLENKFLLPVRDFVRVLRGSHSSRDRKLHLLLISFIHFMFVLLFLIQTQNSTEGIQKKTKIVIYLWIINMLTFVSNNSPLSFSEGDKKCLESESWVVCLPKISR